MSARALSWLDCPSCGPHYLHNSNCCTSCGSINGACVIVPAPMPAYQRKALATLSVMTPAERKANQRARDAKRREVYARMAELNAPRAGRGRAITIKVAP